jgi:hypothetical protein
MRIFEQVRRSEVRADGRKFAKHECDAKFFGDRRKYKNIDRGTAAYYDG